MKSSQHPSDQPAPPSRRKPQSQRRPLPGNALVIAEEPSGYSANPPARPLVLILEERCDSLRAAARLLESSGYATSTVFEESRAIAAILAAGDTHVLLLTVHRTTRALSVPQVIEGLRGLRYDRPIIHCVKGKVTPAMQVAYEALSVNRVLALPAAAQRTVLSALDWLAGQVALGEGGLTILEV